MSGLYQALINNDLNSVELLLHQSVESVNNICYDGKTILNIAIEKNYIDMVKLLVRCGVRLDNRKGYVSPLSLAIKEKNIPMVQTLLTLGADVQEVHYNPLEPMPILFLAMSSLNIDILKLLISKGANVNTYAKSTKFTVLHFLVILNKFHFQIEEKELSALQIEIGKILIKNGADVNAKEVTGCTPLDVAILKRNIGLCKLFLTEGAEVTGSFISPADIPMNRFEYIACDEAFKCPDLVRLCLERGCDYNHCGKYDITPYQGALAKHNTEMVKVFWEFGCPFDQPEHQPGKMKKMLWYKPDETDKKILAVQADFIEGIKHNNLELVKSALREGAVPKGCSVEIPSTLHYIAAYGCSEMAKELLSRGVPVNVKNNKQETPLFIAAKRNHLELCKVFLQFGPCFSSTRYLIQDIAKGSTHLRELFQQLQKCFKFVKKGDNRVMKILQNYKLLKDQEMMKVLLNCVNGKGHTLTSEALTRGHLEIAEKLISVRIVLD